MNNKIDLRIEAKSIRKNLDIQLLSNIFINELRKKQYYQNAQNVLIYYPLKYEINCLELLTDSKNFYLPKVYQNELLICPYRLGDKLEKCSLNILEPCTSPINPAILDLVIVPALMVDKKYYRLGYGKGFYDRFFAEFPNLNNVCGIPSDLFIDTLPCENFDIPLKNVIKM